MPREKKRTLHFRNHNFINKKNWPNVGNERVNSQHYAAHSPHSYHPIKWHAWLKKWCMSGVDSNAPVFAHTIHRSGTFPNDNNKWQNITHFPSSSSQSMSQMLVSYFEHHHKRIGIKLFRFPLLVFCVCNFNGECSPLLLVLKINIDIFFLFGFR